MVRFPITTVSLAALALACSSGSSGAGTGVGSSGGSAGAGAGVGGGNVGGSGGAGAGGVAGASSSSFGAGGGGVSAGGSGAAGSGDCATLPYEPSTVDCKAACDFLMAQCNDLTCKTPYCEQPSTCPIVCNTTKASGAYVNSLWGCAITSTTCSAWAGCLDYACAP